MTVPDSTAPDTAADDAPSSAETSAEDDPVVLSAPNVDTGELPDDGSDDVLAEPTAGFDVLGDEAAREATDAVYLDDDDPLGTETSRAGMRAEGDPLAPRDDAGGVGDLSTGVHVVDGDDVGALTEDEAVVDAVGDDGTLLEGTEGAGGAGGVDEVAEGLLNAEVLDDQAVEDALRVGGGERSAAQLDDEAAGALDGLPDPTVASEDLGGNALADPDGGGTA